MNHLYKSFALGGTMLLLMLLVQPAQAQSTTPTSIDIGTDSPICTGEEDVFPVSITLPPGATRDRVDVFLLFDDTGSFAGNVARTSSLFTTIVGNLETALPGVDFGFGIGRFEDYGGPGASYSSENTTGRPFILNQPIITAADAGGASARNTLIADALARTAPGFGGDGPESAIAEGLYQVATGVGFDGDGNGSNLDSGNAGDPTTQTTPGTSGDVPDFASNVAPASGTLGGVGWRSDAQKIVLLATDICSIAAFPAGAPIPANITGAGGSEPTSALSCSATPGVNRFGFVGDSKTSATNTVTNAIVPSEAGTVQETIDALNSLGIQVIGMGPGAAPTTSTTASFDESVFLSALARLTGALDNSGDPLVFNLGSSDADIIADIVNAIQTTTTSEIDITLTSTTLPTGLTFDFTPPQVDDVGPGGTANFDVTLGGDGSEISGAFDIRFLNANSLSILGSVPVSVECAAGGGGGDDECTDPATEPSFDGEVIADGSRRLIEVLAPTGAVELEFYNTSNLVVGDPEDPSGTPLTDYARSGDSFTWMGAGDPPTAVRFPLEPADPSNDKVRFFLKVTDSCERTIDVDPALVLDNAAAGLPEAVALEQNYPNPFNPQTQIGFRIKESTHVTVAVFDMMGRQVDVLVDQKLGAGTHSVTWNGQGSNGEQVASGVYLYRIDAAGVQKTRRMTLLR